VERSALSPPAVIGRTQAAVGSALGPTVARGGFAWRRFGSRADGSGLGSRAVVDLGQRGRWRTRLSSRWQRGSGCGRGTGLGPWRRTHNGGARQQSECDRAAFATGVAAASSTAVVSTWRRRRAAWKSGAGGPWRRRGCVAWLLGHGVALGRGGERGGWING
jgi:hypothetical protein